MKKDRIASGKNQMLKLVGQSMMRSGVLPKYLPTKILTNYNRQISTFTLDNSADSTPPNWSRLTPPVMTQIDIITSWNNVPAVRYSCQHASTLVINRKTQRGGTFYFLKCQGHRRRGEKKGERKKSPNNRPRNFVLLQIKGEWRDMMTKCKSWYWTKVVGASPLLWRTLGQLMKCGRVCRV